MDKILQVKNLNKSFGGLKAIDNLSFEVKTGTITSVIGSNGAGKTTLFNIISSLIPPDSGEIFLNNKRIDYLKPYQIPYLGISRTFQNLSVFNNMSVIENIMVGQYSKSKAGFLSSCLNTAKKRKEEKEIRDRAMYWLSFMNLDDIYDRPINSISFEKQRLVEITRALSSEPEIILLDEPAAGLTINETENLIDSLYKIRELGITILLVEHDMDMVMEVSDKITVLNFGKKIAEGTPEEVSNNPDVISVYLGE
ncbi:hypothetical protein DRJ04_07915 [Candidatus Aerophobetes bacterium]|uniref:ABC transporter domain-containing protein n=1 Tax=Aerophobetes bacterium TaxID=2030807 RepID=A0A662D6X5_UNCAE|nr:MAG: hypothetical protein DRJ04_07915 [Candidatus Aerophobetes bacterium]